MVGNCHKNLLRRGRLSEHLAPSLQYLVVCYQSNITGYLFIGVRGTNEIVDVVQTLKNTHTWTGLHLSTNYLKLLVLSKKDRSFCTSMAFVVFLVENLTKSLL